MEIRAVVFDAGGVLHENVNVAVMDGVRKELGLTHRHMRAIWDEAIPDLGSGKIDESGFWDWVKNEFGTRYVGLDEDLLGRPFAANLQSNSQTLALVQKINNAGLLTAVLSDTIPPHAKVVREAGLYESFDKVFLSHLTGYRKNDDRAFRYAMSKLGTKPPETVFIDDNAQHVETAARLGMVSLHFIDADLLTWELESILEIDLDGHNSATPLAT